MSVEPTLFSGRALSVYDVARRLGQSAAYVRELIWTGAFSFPECQRPYPVSGTHRAYRIPPEALERFIQGKRAEGDRE